MPVERITREEIIAVPDVPQDPIRCPRCKGGNLVLGGYLQRRYDEIWKDGEKLSHNLHDHEEPVHEVDSIECWDCGIRFRLQTRQVYELMKENGELKDAIGKLTGTGRPC